MRKTKAMFPHLSLSKPPVLPGVAQGVPVVGQQQPNIAYVALVQPQSGMTTTPMAPSSMMPGALHAPNQAMLHNQRNNVPGMVGPSNNMVTNTINQNSNMMIGAPPMGGMMTPAMATGMSEAFLVLYRIITVIVTLMFLLVVVFTTTDIFKYMLNEASQRLKRFYDPNMYNKDTTDIDALRYISASAAEDETYNIFKTQRFISYIFMIVGVAVIILGLQIGLFFGMKLWAIFNGRVFNERVQLPMKLLAVMLIIVIGGFAVKDVYTQRFTKRVQTSLVEMRTQLSAIRTFIYNNLTKDPNFLRALVADDIDMMSKVITDTLKTKRGDCTNSTKPCDTDVENMIFSMNLYSFMRYHIPSSDPNFENVTKLFTPDGVTNRTVDPTMYFYYKQPTYIPNLYPSIRDKLGATPFHPPSGSMEAKMTAASSRERIMMLNINNKMQDLNTKLTRMYNLTAGKINVGTYLVVVALVVLVFCLVLFAMFLPEMMPYVPVVWGAVKGIWDSLWHKNKDVKS